MNILCLHFCQGDARAYDIDLQLYLTAELCANHRLKCAAFRRVNVLKQGGGGSPG